MKLKKVISHNGRETKKTKPVKEKPALQIDFPQEGEKLTRNHYAVRLSINGIDHVEISVNDQPWQPCRPSLGYMWYDWVPQQSGDQQLVLRARMGNGRWFKSSVRTCTVE